MIYLDNAATTRPVDMVLDGAVSEMKAQGFYNPSALYKSAMAVKSKIENVRKDILRFFPLGYDLVYTSGGTEGDNLALFSCVNRGNVVSTAGEHSAVYNCINQIKQNGVEGRFAKLNKDGSVDVDNLLSLVDEKTTLVSVVHVNNETGAINDINHIAKLVKQKNSKVIFHSDGVQAFLKIPHKITSFVDLYTISAHKICALKGTGALIYKKGVHIKSMIFGGGQEKNIRSGTENTFGIYAMGIAVKLFSNVEENYDKAIFLRNLFIDRISKHATIISGENSSPYIISISIPGVKAEIMQRVLEDSGIVVGTGSACSSKLGTSRIISNLGIDKKTAEGVLRISLIYTTTKEEVETGAEAIIECANQLRKALR